MTHWPEWQVPGGYLLRRFRDGDEEAYVELMHVAGFATWNRNNLSDALENAVPNVSVCSLPTGPSLRSKVTSRSVMCRSITNLG